MSFRRPNDNRPKNKKANRPAPPSEFSPLMAELLSTRAQYEALRSSDGSFFERAVLQGRLHELRADLAAIRPAVH